MIKLVEGASRQKTPNEIALNILLAGLTIIFLLAVVTLQPFAIYSGAPQNIFVLVSLLVCLIPTTIGGLLSAIGIAGMDRMIQRNVIAMSGRAVEASGDVDVLLLDKTGTITLGNRAATQFFPAPGIEEAYLADAAQLSSLADETPEGRSIVVLAKERYKLRGRDLSSHGTIFIPFTAQTRMSGVDIDGREIRKGALDAISRLTNGRGNGVPADVQVCVREISNAGGTPLLVTENGRVLGAIALTDIVKGGMKERFRPSSRDGHSHDDDHRRQPADRGGYRPSSRSRRFPRRSDARRQDGADQAGAIERQACSHDRRWHERRSSSCTGGRWRRHEHRHASRKRSRQHGGSRFQPDEADRDRRNRQAAPDYTWRADNVLRRERCGEILRHHSRDVRGGVSSIECAERDASSHAAISNFVRG